MLETQLVLPHALHIIDGLWFVATQKALPLQYSSHKRKGSQITDSPWGMIKLDMSCTATNDYFRLLPYHHNESKYTIKDHFTDNLNSYNGSKFQIGKPFLSNVPNFTKLEIQKKLL